MPLHYFLTNGLAALIPFLLILDIAVSLSTGYFEKGQLVRDRALIVRNWLRNMAIFEILPAVAIVINVYFEIGTHPSDLQMLS